MINHRGNGHEYIVYDQKVTFPLHCLSISVFVRLLLSLASDKVPHPPPCPLLALPACAAASSSLDGAFCSVAGRWCELASLPWWPCHGGYSSLIQSVCFHTGMTEVKVLVCQRTDRTAKRCYNFQIGWIIVYGCYTGLNIRICRTGSFYQMIKSPLL